MQKAIVAVLISGLLAFGSGIHAQEQMELEVSANMTLATDYSFRGWSQTTRDPAIQGGIDVAFDNGVWVGTWASNVNFGMSNSMELDIYVGYSQTVNEDLSWDLTAISFSYPSEGNILDYYEFGGSVYYKDLTFGLMMSQEYLGNGGPVLRYPYASYSFALNENFSLDLQVGWSMVDQENFFGEDDSYMDFSATVTRPWEGLDVSLALVGTTLEDNEDTDTRLILSFSTSF